MCFVGLIATLYPHAVSPFLPAAREAPLFSSAEGQRERNAAHILHQCWPKATVSGVGGPPVSPAGQMSPSAARHISGRGQTRARQAWLWNIPGGVVLGVLVWVRSEGVGTTWKGRWEPK